MRKLIKLGFGVLVAAAFGLSGCGGGGGGSSTTSATDNSSIAKTSVIDGTWTHSSTENESTMDNLLLLQKVTFSNGLFRADETPLSYVSPNPADWCWDPFNSKCGLGTASRFRNGQFEIVGNTINMTNVYINGGSWSGVPYTRTCTFTLNNGVLILTDNSTTPPGVATYNKQ